MSDIFDQIIQKLHQIETNKQVKIIFAIESGSRSWGFHSPDSDYDCRFVYVHPKDFYVSVFDKKDFIESANDKVFDVVGWDLKKFILHITKSNATTFEWLSSDDVYMKHESMQLLKDLSTEFFNPLAVSYHYLNLAKNFYKDIVLLDECKIKKYFYILRPIACLNYIAENKTAPFMKYKDNLDESYTPQAVLEEINELMEIKKDVEESFKIPRNEILLNYFEQTIDAYERNLKNDKFTKNRDYSLADDCFRKIIETMWQHD